MGFLFIKIKFNYFLLTKHENRGTVSSFRRYRYCCVDYRSSSYIARIIDD